MRSTFSIFRLTLRSILRERVALSMLVLLALVLTLLPMGLRGDGTVEGALRMHIRYTLGFSTALLAGMTLWVSCASIAGDLSSKRIQMVLAKPVSRAAVWWGKWLAVSGLVTTLLMICGAATLFRVHRLVDAADPEARRELDGRILSARLPAGPEIEDLTPRARDMLEEQTARGAVPPDMPEKEALKQMLRYVRVMRHAAPAGGEVTWLIPLEKPVEADETLQLAYRFDGASMGVATVDGDWTVRVPGDDAVFTRSVKQSPHGEHVLDFNHDGAFAGARVLEVRFLNRNTGGDMVFFKPDGGVRIYRPAGGFAPNLFRALLLLSGLLALLAAIGVGAGSVFSLPVACYATSVVLILRAFSGVVEEAARARPAPAGTEEVSAVGQAYDTARRQLYRALLVVLKPVEIEQPLDRVSRGVLVSWREVGGTLALRFAPVLLLIAGIGVFLFSRRETGGAV